MVPHTVVPVQVVPADVIPADMVSVHAIAPRGVALIATLGTAKLVLQRRQQGADDTVGGREMRPSDTRGGGGERAWDVDHSSTLRCSAHARQWARCANEQSLGLIRAQFVPLVDQECRGASGDRGSLGRAR